jgi:hypothetical protein
LEILLEVPLVNFRPERGHGDVSFRRIRAFLAGASG